MFDSITIHEAAHAVAGLCLGRYGLLKKVSVVATPEMKGGCHWNVTRGPCQEKEQNQEIAIGFAGPIGQVLYVPDSLGAYAEAFASTILQPDDILEKAGCAGWASTDLSFVVWMRDRGLPIIEFLEIEKLVRSLLSRQSVSAAIKALARSLEVQPEIDGLEAEGVMAEHLALDDYVGSDYVNKKEPNQDSTANHHPGATDRS